VGLGATGALSMMISMSYSFVRTGASFLWASCAEYRVAVFFIARLFVHWLIAAGVVFLFLCLVGLLRGCLVAIEIVVGFVCHGAVIFDPPVKRRACNN